MKVARTFRIEEEFAKRLEKESREWTKSEGRKVSQADVLERTFGLYDEARGELASARPGVQVSSAGMAIVNWWAKQDGVTVGEIVEKALALYDDVGSGKSTNWRSGEGISTSSRIPNTLPQEILNDGVLPGEYERSPVARSYEPSKESAAPVPDSATSQCVHCTKPIHLSPGQKPTSLCGDCFRDGHRNTANCQPCARREHRAKLAGQSTSCEPGGIEFDPDWGP